MSYIRRNNWEILIALKERELYIGEGARKQRSLSMAGALITFWHLGCYSYIYRLTSLDKLVP